MIFAWPDYLIVKNVDVISNQPIVSSEARNLKIFTREISGHRFDINLRIDIKPVDRKKASGFLTALQADGNFVSYSAPEWAGNGGTKVTNGARVAGDRSISFTSITNVSLFDWLTFSNHDKLYRINSILGNTVTLNTRLQSDVPGSTNVELATPTGLYELSPQLKNSSLFNRKLLRQLSSFNLRLVEAI
jgi:hypothetical protein